MFSMSVKSVPGSLVLMAPSVIGVPLAAVPGLGPHEDVLLDPLDELLLAAVVVDDDAAGAAAVLEVLLALALPLLLLLLPQPATKSNPRTATTGSPIRTRGTCWNILTDLLLLEELCLHPPQVGERGDSSRWENCMQ
jgi:hypothetical protein